MLVIYIAEESGGMLNLIMNLAINNHVNLQETFIILEGLAKFFQVPSLVLKMHKKSGCLD